MTISAIVIYLSIILGMHSSGSPDEGRCVDDVDDVDDDCVVSLFGEEDMGCNSN